MSENKEQKQDDLPKPNSRQQSKSKRYESSNNKEDETLLNKKNESQLFYDSKQTSPEEDKWNSRQDFESKQNASPQTKHISVQQGQDGKNEKSQTLPQDPQNESEVKLYLMKRQNDRLRQELKVINQFLTSAIEKQNAKKPLKQQTDLVLKDDTLKVEINNAQKQIESYKKEIRHLNIKLDQNTKPETLDQLKNLNAEKDGIILKLQQENKALTKVQRGQEKALVDFQESDKQKKQIQGLHDEIKLLKEQLKEAKKKERVLPVIVRPNNHPSEEGQQSSSVAVVETKQNRAQSTTKVNQIENTQKVQEMEKNVQILQKIRKQYDNQMESLYARIKHLEGENSNLKQSNEEKTKELNNLIYRVPQQQGLRKKQMDGYDFQLEVRALDSKHDQRIIEKPFIKRPISKTPTRKQQKLVQYKQTDQSLQMDESNEKSAQKNQKLTKSQEKRLSTIPKPIDNGPAVVRHMEKGTINSINTKFSDLDILKGKYKQKICKIKLWMNDDKHIKGIQALYSTSSNELVEGSVYAIIKPEGFLVYQTEFQQFDYLKQISGGIGLTGNIEQLELTSHLNKTYKYGLEQVGQRKFKFEIPEDEVPVCLFGSLNLKSNSSVLATIGFHIVRDEVYEEF